MRHQKQIYPLLLATLSALGGCASSAVPAAPSPEAAPPAAASPAAAVADEDDPLTHVNRLSDESARAFAMRRMTELLENAMVMDNQNVQGPHTKPLLDKIVGPLSQLCESGGLDETTQTKVVRVVAGSRDPRGAACLIKTLENYLPEHTEDAVGAAAQAVGAMKLKDAQAPLFAVFTKLHHARPKASAITRIVHEALLSMPAPAWESPCITMIGVSIPDRKDINILKNEFYWQITCAEILGHLKARDAVKPLIKIVLSPVKADAAATAIYALIKIGKPAVSPLVNLLNGADTDLVEYARLEHIKGHTLRDEAAPVGVEKAAKTAYLAPAALMLGSIGLEEASQPMLDALSKADDVDKVVIARELMKLPTTQASVDAMKRVFEKTPITLTIPPGNGAREALLDTIGFLYDARLVPWVVKTALEAKGEDGDVESIRGAALVTALKLMKLDQIAEVDKLAASKITGPDGKPSTIGVGYEKEYNAVKALLKECGNNIECYYGKLKDPRSHIGENQIVGIKSVTMVGVLGGPEVRAKLIELMPSITNAAVKFGAVMVIDRLSPKGDPTIAAALQTMVDDAAATKDGSKIASVAPFKMVIYRLNTRAQ